MHYESLTEWHLAKTFQIKIEISLQFVEQRKEIIQTKIRNGCCLKNCNNNEILA